MSIPGQNKVFSLCLRRASGCYKYACLCPGLVFLYIHIEMDIKLLVVWCSVWDGIQVCGFPIVCSDSPGFWALWFLVEPSQVIRYLDTTSKIYRK